MKHLLALALMDKHNFGKSVAAEQVATDLFYRKPRTLFWEHLLFGETSPIRSIFSDFTIEAKEGRLQFTDLIFNLQFPNMSDLSHGLSKAILRSNIQSQSKTAFGALLGYCYAFGLQDMHFDNVIPEKDFLQVIDNESVFTLMTLPHETLLLPFKTTGFNKAACVHVFDQWPLKSESDAFSVLSGFIQVLEHLISQRSALLATLVQFESEMAKHPIRVIVRDTKEYRDFLEDGIEPEKPLFEFERVQLRRRDVPYFFKFMGGRDLFAYNDRSGNFTAVSDPNFDITLTHPIGSNPGQLLSEDRLTKHILPTGVLFLSKLLIPNSWNGVQNFGKTILELNQNQIELRIQNKLFEAAR